MQEMGIFSTNFFRMEVTAVWMNMSSPENRACLLFQVLGELLAIWSGDKIGVRRFLVQL